MIKEGIILNIQIIKNNIDKENATRRRIYRRYKGTDYRNN